MMRILDYLIPPALGVALLIVGGSLFVVGYLYPGACMGTVLGFWGIKTTLRIGLNLAFV